MGSKVMMILVMMLLLIAVVLLLPSRPLGAVEGGGWLGVRASLVE